MWITLFFYTLWSIPMTVQLLFFLAFVTTGIGIIIWDNAKDGRR